VEPIPEEQSPQKSPSEIETAVHEVSVDQGEHQEKRKRPPKDAAVLQDPTVKYFLDTFNAQILSVEPIKKGKK
jgi:hypothetical protein